METTVYYDCFIINHAFKKDLIVWKHELRNVGAEVSFQFKKDLIVWKHYNINKGDIIMIRFKKDLIVWKQL